MAPVEERLEDVVVAPVGSAPAPDAARARAALGGEAAQRSRRGAARADSARGILGRCPSSRATSIRQRRVREDREKWKAWVATCARAAKGCGRGRRRAISGNASRAAPDPRADELILDRGTPLSSGGPSRLDSRRRAPGAGSSRHRRCGREVLSSPTITREAGCISRHSEEAPARQELRGGEPPSCVYLVTRAGRSAAAGRVFPDRGHFGASSTRGAHSALGTPRQRGLDGTAGGADVPPMRDEAVIGVARHIFRAGLDGEADTGERSRGGWAGRCPLQDQRVAEHYAQGRARLENGARSSRPDLAQGIHGESRAEDPVTTRRSRRNRAQERAKGYDVPGDRADRGREPLRRVKALYAQR